MNTTELVAQIAIAAKLSEADASRVLDECCEVIGRELSVGEAVEVDDLGTFYTVKYPAETVEDPPGSGKTRITMPTIEAEFEPDAALVKFVKKQMDENPELFKESELPDMPDDDEAALETPAASLKVEASSQDEVIAPLPAPIEQPKEEPAKSKEKPLGKASNIRFIDLQNVKVDKEILALVPVNLAKQYSLVPTDLKEGVLTLAMIDPEDFDALQIIRKETGLAIEPVLTTRDGLMAVLDQYTGLQAEVQEVIDSSDFGFTKKEIEEASDEDMDPASDDAPTAHIVHSLLKRAIKERASDVHIEPYENKVVVRFRIDGILMQKVELPKEIQSAIIARLKILANLKIDEQRLPQDGRFSLFVDKRQVDFRFSTIPVVFGEKVVMRILDKSVGILDLEDVGLIDEGFKTLTKNMKRSHGMILVTGPTGSGKTTSLYAVLGKLMSPDVNILTLEDPVEYRVESINQSQVHTEIGYGFGAGLRAVVRQDPDIVMIGEIRDQETADMAIHAALTGHIVLSTLHTNDAAGAFPRLIDMGIEPFLITSSVHTVIGQRLTRKICEVCKELVQLPKEEIEEIEVEIEKMPKAAQESIKSGKPNFYHGKGCTACGNKGYKGRIGVFEVLDVTEEIRGLVLKRSSGAVITESAVKNGMVTMVQDGILKALKGMTTIEEVWRVTRE